jgi:hypothetical protein
MDEDAGADLELSVFKQVVQTLKSDILYHHVNVKERRKIR